jgi:hypothetical protein
LLGLGGAAAIWALWYGNYLSGDFSHPDYNRADQLGKFVSALVVPLFTLGSTLLIIENLRISTLESFISDFFKLIDFHHNLVNNINDNVDYISEGNNTSSKGRAFFDDLAWRIYIDYTFLNNRNKGLTMEAIDSDKPEGQQITLDTALLSITDKKDKDLLLAIYEHYFHIHQSTLGHYFRDLYHIVSFVNDHTAISESEKKKYMGILRAQLSNYEILLLAYNGMYKYGAEFKPLIESFDLIKNLNNEIHVPPNRIKRIIDIELIGKEYPHWHKTWAPPIKPK